MRSVLMMMLLAALLLPAAARGEEERVNEEFADGSGFSYALPAGWKATERKGQKFKFIINEAGATAGLAPNIMVKDGVFPGKLADFAEQTKAGFKKMYPNFNELGADQMRATDESEFIRVIATNEINGHKVRQSFFMYAGPQNIKVALTCTIPVEVAERYDGALESTAKSFRFEKGIVVSTVLTAHFVDLMKRMVSQIKESGELGKSPSDEDIKTKVIDPVFEGLTADHTLEVTKAQERNFAADTYLEESNQKILNELCSFTDVFKTEKPVATKFIIAEQKAGHLKGADVEVAIRILKWSLNKMKESLKANQQTKDVNHPEPPVGPKAPDAPPVLPPVAPKK